ncbi:hypothetical protein BJ742DRAFT_193701 [Cladochytrium replicatum]|nr:hypothetical protein BJ742DRAFT_193701 [Cladochytrium replicatum]
MVIWNTSSWEKNAGNRESNYFPLPPTPTRSVFPLGDSRILLMKQTWLIASLKRARFCAAFSSEVKERPDQEPVMGDLSANPIDLLSNMLDETYLPLLGLKQLQGMFFVTSTAGKFLSSQVAQIFTEFASALKTRRSCSIWKRNMRSRQHTTSSNGTNLQTMSRLELFCKLKTRRGRTINKKRYSMVEWRV